MPGPPPEPILPAVPEERAGPLATSYLQLPQLPEGQRKMLCIPSFFIYCDWDKTKKTLTTKHGCVFLCMVSYSFPPFSTSSSSYAPFPLVSRVFSAWRESRWSSDSCQCSSTSCSRFWLRMTTTRSLLPPPGRPRYCNCPQQLGSHQGGGSVDYFLFRNTISLLICSFLFWRGKCFRVWQMFCVIFWIQGLS